MSETGKYVRRGAAEIHAMKIFYDADGGRSFAEVGIEFGISPARVEQLFRQHNVKTRPQTVSKKFLAAMQERRILLDQELLAELYLKEKLSISRIAARLGAKSDIVRSNLIACRIPIRPRSRYTTTRLTPELLRPLYIEQNLTAGEIAGRLGYSVLTIRKRLFLFGIKKRTGGSRTAEVAAAESSSSAPAQLTVETTLKISESNPDAAAEGEFFTVAEIAEKYQLHSCSVRNSIRNGIFPHAFRQNIGKIRQWLVPAADLQNFVPRRRGGMRCVAPTTATIESRGVRARSVIRKSHGYGKAAIAEMIALKKQGLTRLEIAVRFRLEESLIADIFEQSALRRPKREPRPVRKPKRLPEKLLIEMYVQENTPTADIVAQLNTNYTALYVSLRHYGIPLRDDRLRRAAQTREQVLRHLSAVEEMTVEAIADRLNLTAPYVRRKLNELKIRK